MCQLLAVGNDREYSLEMSFRAIGVVHSFGWFFLYVVNSDRDSELHSFPTELTLFNPLTPFAICLQL